MDEAFEGARELCCEKRKDGVRNLMGGCSGSCWDFMECGRFEVEDLTLDFSD